MFAIVIDNTDETFGVKLTDVPSPTTMKAEDILIEHTSFGLSFDDVLVAGGRYNIDYTTQAFKNNGILGLEAAGIVRKVGSKVDKFQIGNRVMYSMGAVGAFCQQRAIHNSLAFKIPDNISDDTAVSFVRKALWAHTLIYRVVALHKDWVVMIHNVTDPMESILCSWANASSLVTIGTVDTEEKKERAIKMGCQLVINRTEEDMYNSVLHFTEEKGARVIFDSVGGNIFEQSVACMQHLGVYVNYQSKSWEDINVLPKMLSEKSLFLSCPTLEHYKSNTTELLLGFESAFDALLSKKIIKPSFTKASISDSVEIIVDIANGATSENFVFGV